MDESNRRRFDDYEIDLGTGELRRNGLPIPLQRQPARVLARLVRGAGALVRREDLQAAVWGEGVHVDFDRGLNYCIRQLRQALGDDAKAPRFIETVARQGYRFVAAVDVVQMSTPAAPSPRTARTAGCRRVSAAVAAILLLGLAVDRAGGGNPKHHEMAVSIVQAVHDAVF